MDLLVVGLDLVTRREVHAGDREAWEWHGKGHNGDRTLVCRECYEGADLPGGPRVVALVPKGRKGGVRRPHFAHPPGMAPPDGRHNPETLWHAEGKQQLRRWAEAHRATARVEAWTDDGRRRSDVAITLPSGDRVALEVQLGDITDAEWLARHDDYVRTGITDVWLWHPSTWVPRVIFDCGQPGWRLNVAAGKIGLIYHRANQSPVNTPGEPPPCRTVHWPPCPADPLDTLWMPLASARLTPEGINPSADADGQLTWLAKAAVLRAQGAEQTRLPAARRTREYPPQPVVAPPVPRTPDGGGQRNEHAPARHLAVRYDAFPPWTDPDTWWYYCDTCGDRITGAELKSSPIVHIAGTTKNSSLGQLEVIYTQYGGRSSR